MRFFIILCLAVGHVYGTAAAAASSATASDVGAASPPTEAAAGMVSEGPISSAPEDVCVRRDFPNYFAGMNADEAKRSINLSLRSILDYLEVPYVEKGQTQIRHDGFFKKIQQIVDTKAPGAKAYISGGMVRSLLGYIYKRKHNYVLDEQSTDEEDPLETTPKSLTTLKTLGVGSDFDVLIEFSPNFKGNKQEIIAAVETFINSAQTHLGLTNDQSELKRAMVPDADVNEYSVQMDASVAQGGATLDWLAFSLLDGMLKLPDGHSDIIDDFIHGHLRYIANSSVTDKQTMRGLRILLEIPFLSFDEESAKVIAEELRKIIGSEAPLSPGAEEQLKKMTRNARFGGASNRFAGGHCMPDGEITVLVQQLAEKLSRKTLVPEFVGRRSVKNRPIEASCHSRGGGNPVLSGMPCQESLDPRLRGDDNIEETNAPTFIPYSQFIAKHTDKNVLYHGTPDVMNFLSMLRNGLLVSSTIQGGAAYGRGVYTTKDRATAEGYARDTGIVIPLTIHKSARIIDMGIEERRKHYTDWLQSKRIQDKNLGDSFKEYSDEFGIDIIINTHILVQNAKAIKLEKNLNSIIEAGRALVRKKIKDGAGVTIRRLFSAFSPTEGYGKMLPPTTEDLQLIHALSQLFDEAVIKNSPDYQISAELLTKMPDLNQLIEADVMRKLNAEDITLMRNPADRNFSNLSSIIIQKDLFKQLVDNKVIAQINVSDLSHVYALTADKVNSLISLFQAGVLMKSSAYDLLHAPALTADQVDSLTRLFKAGIIGQTNIISLKDAPALTADKVDSLIHLTQAAAEGKLSIAELKGFIELSGTDQIDLFIRLIKEGVIDKINIRTVRWVQSWLNDLERISSTLSVDKVNSLISLFKAGVLMKSSAYDLIYAPALAADQVDSLIRLFEAGVLMKSRVDDLIHVPADLSPAILQIEQLKAQVQEKGEKLYVRELPRS